MQMAPFGPPAPTDRQKCGTAIEIPKDRLTPGDVVADDDERAREYADELRAEDRANAARVEG